MKMVTTRGYKAVKNCELHLDIYPSTEKMRQPCILWLHGGGLILGSRLMLPPEQAQRYTQAGYCIVAADYRLAPETKLAEIMTDVLDAYQWIQTHGDEINVDTTRIALIGHSAGAYLALSVAGRIRPSPKALISFYGYGDISREWAVAPSHFYRQQGLIPSSDAYRAISRTVISQSSIQERMQFYLYCRQNGLWVKEIVGKEFKDYPILTAKYCPIHAISPGYPATLLIHGDADTDVPISESMSLAEKLSEAGVSHSVLILPGYGHAFDIEGSGMQDALVSHAFDTVIDFLNHYV